MFIQTEETPNPESLKFIPGKEVNTTEPLNFNESDDKAQSPLVEKLFALGSVKNVFLGSNFITITKKEDQKWEIIKPEILVLMMEYFISNEPILAESESIGTNEILEDDDELTKQIKELIRERVRPAVSQDGGDITFVSFKNGIVLLELKGACAGCPSSTITLKNGIESMLKHYVPEIIAVEAI